MRHGVKKSSVSAEPLKFLRIPRPSPRVGGRSEWGSRPRRRCRKSSAVTALFASRSARDVAGGTRCLQEFDEDAVELFNRFLMHEVTAGEPVHGDADRRTRARHRRRARRRCSRRRRRARRATERACGGARGARLRRASRARRSRDSRRARRARGRAARFDRGELVGGRAQRRATSRATGDRRARSRRRRGGARRRAAAGRGRCTSCDAAARARAKRAPATRRCGTATVARCENAPGASATAA